MQTIKVEPTIDTPFVELDSTAGKFEISGKSYPEDIIGFYGPILQWLDEYGQNPNADTTFIFKLIYFNSSSYKPFLDIIQKLEEISSNGTTVKVSWHYKRGDFDIMEAGEDFMSLVTVPFEIAEMD